MVTIKDIAHKAGVAKSTVSYKKVRYNFEIISNFFIDFLYR